MATVRRSVRRTVAGACAGGILGYYLGAKAGRGRYEAINRTVARVGGFTRAGTAARKARALADLSVEQARAAMSRVPGPFRAAPPRPPEPEADASD